MGSLAIPARCFHCDADINFVAQGEGDFFDLIGQLPEHLAVTGEPKFSRKAFPLVDPPIHRPGCPVGGGQ